MSPRHTSTSVGIGALLFSAFLYFGCVGPGSHSSDAKLEKRFRTHEWEFEALLSMIQLDDRIMSITATSIIPSGGRPYIRRDDLAQIEKSGLSKRWFRYQKLLDELCISGVGRGDPDPHARSAGFIAEPASLWNGATSKGYVWSEEPLEPSVPDLDRYRPRGDEVRRRPYVAYKKIKANWYMFFQRE